MSMPAATHWVDVHHHGYHPDLVREMQRRGVDEMAPGVPVPRWTPLDSIGVMDRNGVSTALLSVLLPDPATRVGGGGGPVLVRRANEILAGLVQDRPDRFGALAGLPLPDVDRALEEIAYVDDVLKVDGICLSASQGDGRYLGDPVFDDVLAELDRRRLVVFIHPNPSYRCVCRGGPGHTSTVPPPLVDFATDTTRAVAQLLYSGRLQRYSHIRFILAHAGGTVPYLAHRLELARSWVLAGTPGADQEVTAQLRRLYYELAQSASPGALRCLRSITDDSHILFGTDFPFLPEAVVAATRQGVREMSDLDHDGVGRAHAVALFPRLATDLDRAHHHAPS